jgi:adenine phosphoribosyltransferase
MAALAEDGVGKLVADRVRDVPDYPRPGVLFKDITPLLADPAAFAAVVEAIAAHYADARVDKVVGIEARGFILAAPVAFRLGAGFVPVRKKGKLPGKTLEETYDLEYGTETIQVHEDAFLPGERVLIVDDVLATGGTANATVSLVTRSRAEAVGLAVLLDLAFLGGRSRLPRLDVQTLLTVS